MAPTTPSRTGASNTARAVPTRTIRRRRAVDRLVRAVVLTGARWMVATMVRSSPGGVTVFDGFADSDGERVRYERLFGAVHHERTFGVKKNPEQVFVTRG